MSAIVGQVIHFEFSHARIKIAVHVGSVGVMISIFVIDQVFLVRIVSVLDGGGIILSFSGIILSFPASVFMPPTIERGKMN